MRVEFEQVFTATTVVSAVSSSTSGANTLSARPDATQQTGLGPVNPSAVPATTQTQFQIPQQNPLLITPGTVGTADDNPDLANALNNLNVDVPGAGGYSSVPGQQALP
jgi:hypothetical protein